MRTLVALAVALALVACAGDPVPLTNCTAGASTACACSSGATGAQVCRADGSGYGACVCTSDAGADAVGDVAVGDAGPDALQLDAASDGGSDADVEAPDGGPGRCPGLLPMCNGVCMPLHDPRNCGRCGVSCSDGWVCTPVGMFGECVPPDAGADVAG